MSRWHNRQAADGRVALALAASLSGCAPLTSTGHAMPDHTVVAGPLEPAARDATRPRAGVMNRWLTAQGRSDVSLPADIIDRTWTIERIGQDDVARDARLTLTFSVNGRLSGRSGCNSFMGLYGYDGQRLTIYRLTSSRRACLPAVMVLERAFVDALQDVVGANASDGTLAMRTAGGLSVTAR